MGYTPILRAEFYGHVDAFGLLYDAGANLSIIKVKVKCIMSIKIHFCCVLLLLSSSTCFFKYITIYVCVCIDSITHFKYADDGIFS